MWPTPTDIEWYNPAAYAEPAAVHLRECWTQQSHGPGPRLSRLVVDQVLCHHGETHLDLKWDAFNALNRENLANPPVPAPHLSIMSTPDKSTALLISGGVCSLESTLPSSSQLSPGETDLPRR